MKLITKLAAGAFAAIAFMAWQNDRNNPDGRDMERLHADEGMHRMDCTESEYQGNRWMACRYPDQEQRGSLWVWHDDTFGGSWVARNDLAHRVANSALEKARQNETTPAAAIAWLNPLTEEYREWSQSLPVAPWEHLD